MSMKQTKPKTPIMSKIMVKSSMIKTIVIKIRVLKKIVLVASALVLTACATATPYQPSANTNMRNGFSELKIENDRVKVTFDGNSLTDRQTVETYLLYRSAELTKSAGYDYFTLTDRATDKKIRIQDTGFQDPYYGLFNYSYFHPGHGWSSPYYRPYYHSFYRSSRSHFGGRYGRYSPFNDNWGSGFDYREITRYRASAEVKFGRGAKPETANNAFNAQEVLDNLGDKIIYPEIKEAKN